MFAIASLLEEQIVWTGAKKDLFLLFMAPPTGYLAGPNGGAPARKSTGTRRGGRDALCR
ncbi:MAG: hypothetical protein H7Z39_02175 [Burkholderiaceae bacterium]|nr:hypothetical protein [Burkholderiaceae bacterium]